MDRDEGEVSFNNDEGDGLAALFGGITPSAEPPREPGPRRAAPVEPEPAPVEPPAPVHQPPAFQPPAYQPPAPQQPAYQPPPDYPPPASAAYPPPAPAAPAPPASPAYDLPAPAPAPQAPPSYDLPPPAAAPSATPFAATPASFDPAQPQGGPVQQPYEPPTYEPPTYEPPPSREAPAYDLPAPGEVSYPVEPPSAQAYPPTVQYPTGLDPAFVPPPGPSYDFPASAPPPAQPAPLEEPPAYRPPEQYEAPSTSDDPYGAPPTFDSYAPPSVYPDSSPDLGPAQRSVDEHPLVRSEPAVPATVFPPGPLLPSSTTVETPDDLERSTAVEKIGLVLAVIAGPIGLVMAIVNAARSGRRRGWLIGIVRASLVLGVLSSIAAGIAGYVLWNVRLDQIAHAEVAAASAEFCAAAQVDPAMVTPPTLGWPAEGASVSESITTMQTWTDRWAALAGSSPAKLRTGIELLAQTGQTIVDSVTQARVVDDTTNQAQIAAAAGQSGVAAWHTTYCVAP